MQKSQTPHLDDLLIPQFESESKKTQIKVTNKVAAAPIAEGTSVIPRQRPKAASSAPLSLSNLPITLNSSPTALKTSQSPVFTNENNSRSFSPKSGHPPQNFCSFQSAAQNFSVGCAFTNQQSLISSSQNVSDKDLDTLFQSSSFPDPFRDDVTIERNTPEIASHDNTNLPVASEENARLNLGSGGQNMPSSQGKAIFVESTSQCVVGSSNTPPSTPALSLPRGHRRNMSDTTAFNK